MRWLAAVVAAVLLTGCAASASRGPAPPELVGTGRMADLTFTGVTTEGAAFNGAELQGKPAVLWFWSPWCPTCRAQAAAVSALAQRYDGEVSVIGVGGLDAAPAIRRFAREVPGVTHLIDADGVIWRHFGVTAQSSYEVVDEDGEIVTEGFLNNDELAALVHQLAR